MYSTTPIDPIRWRAIGIMFSAIVLLAIIGALASLRPAAQAEPQPVVIMVATATAAPAQPTPAPRAILGFFDYDNPRSAVALNQGDVARVIGQAGGWRLVETAQGGRAWVGVADVPAGVSVADPLPDLAPPTPAPAPTIIYVMVPAAPLVEPTAETHFEMPSDRPGPQATRVSPFQMR